MRQILRTWHAVLFGFSAVLLLIAIVVAALTARSTANAMAAVNESHRVMSVANRLVARLADAQTEQRGYLLTRAESYLTSFENIAADVLAARTELVGLVADHARQHQRAQELGQLVGQRLEELRAATRAAIVTPGDAALILADEGALRLLMGLRIVHREIIATEQLLLDQRQDRMTQELRAASITIIVTGALALGLATHAFILMRRALAALRREAEILQQKERAERADQEKSEFLANMSHEIRTPMNSVLGFTELLRGIVTTPKQRQYIEAIDASGRAMLSLINDILDLSKIEAGRLELIQRPTSMRALCEDLRKIFGAQAAQNGLQLSFEIAPQVPAAVLVDSLRLRQILFNVIGNALKFTHHGSVQVRVWSHLTPGDETTVSLLIAVADTGVGIASEHQQMVFEPFRQVDSSVSRKVGGTGLGLSITRRLTQLLGGSVQLESELGRGTTFTFSFPRIPISASLPADDVEPPPEEDLDLLRPSLILVADDVHLNRELLSGYFENTRHRLILATSGREALASTRAHHPDLVLMDIRMPDMDGRAAREHIKADPELAAIPVIAVTASSMLSEEQNLRTSFDGYMRKPITRAALFHELSRHLPLARPRSADSAEPAGAREEEELFPASPVPDDPSGWRQLLGQLRELEQTRWPQTVAAMSFRETEAFAHTIVAAARRHECPPALAYGERLLAQVHAFDVLAQEQTLRNFPRIVADLGAMLDVAAP